MAKPKFKAPDFVHAESPSEAAHQIMQSGQLLGAAHLTVAFVRRPDGKVGVHIVPEYSGAIDADALEYALQQGVEQLRGAVNRSASVH